MYSSNGKWRFKVTFDILVSLNNIHQIEKLKTFFGVGKIYTTSINATYRVASIKELIVIIQHFTSYPLISPKLITFKLWAEVVNLINAVNSETFHYIITIYAAIGRGASKAVQDAFPELAPISLPAYMKELVQLLIRQSVCGGLVGFSRFIVTLN